MTVQSDLARLAELEAETEAIEKRLSDRAGEFYREQSGRKHFHALRFRFAETDFLRFTTATRFDDEEVNVPIGFFIEACDMDCTRQPCRHDVESGYAPANPTPPDTPEHPLAAVEVGDVQHGEESLIESAWSAMEDPR